MTGQRLLRSTFCIASKTVTRPRSPPPSLVPMKRRAATLEPDTEADPFATRPGSKSRAALRAPSIDASVGDTDSVAASVVVSPVKCVPATLASPRAVRAAGSAPLVMAALPEIPSDLGPITPLLSQINNGTLVLTPKTPLATLTALRAEVMACATAARSRAAGWLTLGRDAAGSNPTFDAAAATLAEISALPDMCTTEPLGMAA